MCDDPMYVTSNYIEKQGIVGCFAGDIHMIVSLYNNNPRQGDSILKK